LKILLQSPVSENLVAGNQLKKKLTLSVLSIDNKLNKISKNEYIIERDLRNQPYMRLIKRELSNSGQILLTYKDMNSNIETYLIDIENNNFSKTKELLSIDEKTEDMDLRSTNFMQVYNSFTDQIFLFSATVKNSDINFYLTDETSNISKSSFKIPGSENETTKRCEFTNLHSINSISDGFIIISEYTLQKKGEEPKIIGGSQEFKDEYSFGVSNSHIIVTKLNLKGELVWNRIIENVRTHTKKIFPHSFITSGGIAYLLFVDNDIKTQISETKLSEINLKTSTIITKVISSNNQYTKTEAQLHYLNTESEKLYFIQSKGDKITIRSTTLEF